MNWFTSLFSSVNGKKLVMALTGLFLITFLVVHLIGNLQLLKSDGGRAFNVYAEFMTTNPLIVTISYVLYAFILIHVIWSALLTSRNRAARGKVGYKVVRNSSHWTSRNMGILGTFIFIFIVIHMRDFWAAMHWGGIARVTYDGQEVKDLYSVVALAFTRSWYVGLYVVSMLLLAFHLWHGFASAFQTLGLNHVKYNGAIKFAGRAFAIIVPALFALIPILMFAGG
ncbi:MAG TPA: succinate dehydrogenase cytochrome b subunit [Cyclobacteriaceae bacterium]|nr:succinate dehydrogenase cytochrome b subunit [Cyclobacteriaceae bacterium]